MIRQGGTHKREKAKNEAETDGLLIDIGGGSTELVRFSGRKLTGVTSLPYGAVNLTAAFLPDGNNGREAVAAA